MLPNFMTHHNGRSGPVGAGRGRSGPLGAARDRLAAAAAFAEPALCETLWA